MSAKDKGIFLIAMGFCILVVIYAGGYYHELAHQQVADLFGLTNTSIQIHWWGMQTTSYGNCSDACKIAQSNVESVGYNQMSICMWLSLIVILIVVKIFKDYDYRESLT